MDCEIPEVVVFLKENDCQLFKICIDGEVPCHDQCYVENCELDHNTLSNLPKYELAKNSADVSEEMVLYISTRVEESFSNHDCIEDDVKLSGAENKVMEDKALAGRNPDVSTGASCSEKELSDRRDFTISNQITNFSLSQILHSDNLRDEQKYHQEDLKTETISADSCFLSREDCRNTNGVDPRLKPDLWVEKIRDDSDSLLITNEDKSTKSVGVEQRPQGENLHKIADNMTEVTLLASSLSRQSTVGYQELGSSSFSAASTPSDQLTFSGLISCSDSISLRSNSTASARSFAFPILATERYESPIRMAEVEKRRPKSFKKCACWRMCFTRSKF